LIPGPRIRSYDARPNSFLYGIGAGRPWKGPLVRPDLAGSHVPVDQRPVHGRGRRRGSQVRRIPHLRNASAKQVDSR